MQTKQPQLRKQHTKPEPKPRGPV